MSFYYTLYVDNCLRTLDMHKAWSLSENNEKYSKQRVKRTLENCQKQSFFFPKRLNIKQKSVSFDELSHFYLSYSRSASSWKKNLYSVWFLFLPSPSIAIQIDNRFYFQKDDSAYHMTWKEIAEIKKMVWFI